MMTANAGQSKIKRFEDGPRDGRPIAMVSNDARAANGCHAASSPWKGSAGRPAETHTGTDRRGQADERESHIRMKAKPKGGGFRVLDQKTESVAIDSIHPHPRNVNESPSEPLAESIRENGWYGSVIVQKSSGHILAGSHRWKEAKQAGALEIPATFIDVDDQHAIKIMLSDNRSTRLGSDGAGLVDLLQELGDLTGTGFNDGDLEALLGESSMMAFKDTDENGAGGSHSKRDMGNAKVQIKPVLYSEQVAIFERAITATKEQNRGKALIKICKLYLESLEDTGDTGAL